MQNFSIKDLENYTGVKAHTIRIWEQRYGLLKPIRSESNIRRYSDNELKTLLNVSLLNHRGHKISEIVKMDSQMMNQLIEKYSASNENDDTSMATLKLAMLNFDEKLFCSVVDHRIETSGLEDTFLNVLAPFLQDVGMLWLTDTICPAQEHFISNLIRQKLESEINKIDLYAAKEDATTYVLFLPEMEYHEISMIMLNYMLKSRGNKTIYLGQSVPIDDLFQVYQRVGKVHFISHFTSQPAAVLLDSYLKKLIDHFRDSGCVFYFSGEILKDKKSPELGLFQFSDSLNSLFLKHVKSSN